jgi:hypothetical protein
MVREVDESRGGVCFGPEDDFCPAHFLVQAVTDTPGLKNVIADVWYGQEEDGGAKRG